MGEVVVEEEEEEGRRGRVTRVAVIRANELREENEAYRFAKNPIILVSSMGLCPVIRRYLVNSLTRPIGGAAMGGWGEGEGAMECRFCCVYRSNKRSTFDCTDFLSV